MRAQVSMEFMMFFAVMLVMTVVATYVAVKSAADIGVENTNREAKRMAQLVATEVNLAVEVGDGYSHNFTLPGKILGETDYALNVTDQRAYVFWQNRSYSIPVLVYNISGIINRGPNLVRNEGGVITFA